jgi:hypothetical protein
LHPLSRAQARHTGIKITQQIAILMGCAVLPHLKSMVDIIKHGLVDENQKVGGGGGGAAAGLPCPCAACGCARRGGSQACSQQRPEPGAARELGCCRKPLTSPLATTLQLLNPPSPPCPPPPPHPQVKTITALSIAALAGAAAPYGIESFDDVLEPLWKGIRTLRGKVGLVRRGWLPPAWPGLGTAARRPMRGRALPRWLPAAHLCGGIAPRRRPAPQAPLPAALPQVLAAFLKAIGYIIPLMDAEHAFYYTREVRPPAPPARARALGRRPAARGATCLLLASAERHRRRIQTGAAPQHNHRVIAPGPAHHRLARRPHLRR